MKYLELAARIAAGANWNEKHFLLGAVAVRQDGAIITATNLRTVDRHHPAHAEHRILRRCGMDATLYVARVDRLGKWAIAKPCPKCQAYIKNRNVKKVIYTVSHNTYAVWNV